MLLTVLSALHGSSHLIISKRKTWEGVIIFINLNAVMRTRGRGSSDNLPKVTQSLRFVEDGAGIVMQGVWLLHSRSSPLHHSCHEDS